MSDLSPSSRQEISGECSINWTMKQMSDSTVSFVQTRQSLVNALSTELWSKCMPCLFRPRRSLVHALTTEHEANVCLFSSGHLRQAPVNALLTELWSKCQHCLLHPIKAVSGTCSINWTVKQMYALSPSSFQDSLRSMLYQLNYEANVCLVSFWVMLFQLNNEANVCFVSFV